MQTLHEQAYASLWSQSCPLCHRPLSDRAYPCSFCTQGTEAYAPYRGIVAHILQLYKTEGRKSCVKVVAPLFLPMLSSIENPLLIPVPASQKGIATRGFDQMVLITEYLAKITGYPTVRLLIQKGRGQSKFLSRMEREQRSTIELLTPKPGITRGYTPVLLDDITTSGATLTQCKKILWDTYSTKAIALVLALA